MRCVNIFNKKYELTNYTISDIYLILINIVVIFSCFSVDNESKENSANKANKSSEEENLSETEEEMDENQNSNDPLVNKEMTVSDEMLEILGDDPSATNEIAVKFHPELKRRWEKWMQEGFPEENKKVILQKYPRKQDLYTEAPKINLEIAPIMSEIAIKRDQHFLESQNCVGSAISALAAAVSMILEDPSDGIDQEVLTKYLCDVGKLLTDVFYQQSIARKSFITPLLKKAVKPTVEAIKSDEWLYGKKFAEQVKEVEAIGKACATLKAPDKISKAFTMKSRNQGNVKYPPAKYKQVGGYPKRSTIRFKSRNQRTSQSTSKTSSRKSNQSSMKK